MYTGRGKLKYDLIGKRFSRLVVVELVPYHNFKNTNSYWVCQCDCGNKKVVCGKTLREGGCKSCGCLRLDRSKYTGSKNHNWRGGKNRLKNGYIQVYDGKGKPRRYEHSVVMEKFLGRSLLPEETIHHINGKRDDNRIENLELWSSRHPKGQRIQDKIQWAKEILNLYGEFDRDKTINTIVDSENQTLQNK